MKKAKITISILLAVVMTATMAVTFSACEKNNSASSNLKGTTIRFLSWYDPSERDGEQEAINKYEEESGVTVKIEIVSFEEYYQKLSAMIATGDAPDVCRLKNQGTNYLKLLQPLSTAEYDFSDEKWDKATMELYSVNGVQYAAAITDTPFFLPAVCYYNKTVLSENGIDNPYTLWKEGKWNWNSFRQICKDFTALSDENIGSSFCPLETVALTRNADIVAFDGSKYTNNINNSVYLDSWRFTCDMIKDGLMSRDINKSNEFVKGQVGLFIYDATEMQKNTTVLRRLKAKNELGVVPVPSFEGEDSYTPMQELVAFGIPNGAKNPTAVPSFLEAYLDFSNYDKDSFFYDDQAREVYDALTAIDKRCVAVSEGILSEDIGATSGNVNYTLVRTDSVQLNTAVQEYSNIIDVAVRNANESLSKLEK